jgi:hypothetical protein
MQKLLLKTAAGIVFMAVAAGSVQAMPMQPAPSDETPALTLVSGGCGPYAHRGPYGGCRPGGGWGGPGWGWRHRGWGGWHGGWHRGWHRW